MKIAEFYLYKTKVSMETLEGECSCPYNHNCKHAVAAYLFYKEGLNKRLIKENPLEGISIFKNVWIFES